MIPLWIKIGYALFMAVLLPVYWHHYTPVNYLWFCDVALLLTLVGLWTESGLLIGAAALSVVLCDTVWMVDFAVTLATGNSPTGLAGYMIDAKLDLFLRALSLFHIWFPVLLVWLLWKLGYDPRALPLQILISSLILPLSYLLTDGRYGPPKNVNQVYGPGADPQTWMHPWLWIGLLMVAFPALVYVPTHLVFSWLFGKNTPI